MLLNLSKTFLSSLLDLAYPPHCMHCDEKLPQDYRLICSSCWKQLELSDPEDHCRHCYNWLENPPHPACKRCQEHPSPFLRLISTFDSTGPCRAIQRRYHETSGAYLLKGASALMAYHYIEQHMPWPDLIIPLPQHPFKRILSGHSPSNVLASQVATLFNIPFQRALNCSGFMQANYSLAKNYPIEDKRVLLIGDQLTNAFFAAAEALVEGYPAQIIGMTFCGNRIMG